MEYLLIAAIGEGEVRKKLLRLPATLDQLFFTVFKLTNSKFSKTYVLFFDDRKEALHAYADSNYL